MISRCSSKNNTSLYNHPKPMNLEQSRQDIQQNGGAPSEHEFSGEADSIPDEIEVIQTQTDDEQM